MWTTTLLYNLSWFQQVLAELSVGLQGTLSEWPILRWESRRGEGHCCHDLQRDAAWCHLFWSLYTLKHQGSQKDWAHSLHWETLHTCQTPAETNSDRMGVLFTLAVERIPTREWHLAPMWLSDSIADYGKGSHRSENALTHWEEQVAGMWPVREGEKVGTCKSRLWGWVHPGWLSGLKHTDNCEN